MSQLHSFPKEGPLGECVEAEACSSMPYDQVHRPCSCAISVERQAALLVDRTGSLVAVMMTVPRHVHLNIKSTRAW